MPRILLCWKELGALGQLPGPAALPWPLQGIPHLQFYPVIIPSQPLSDVSWSHPGREVRTGLGVHGKLSTPSGSAELCRQLGQRWEFWHLPPELGHCRTSLRSPAHEEGHFNQEESTLIPPGPQLLVLRAAGDVFPSQPSPCCSFWSHLWTGGSVHEGVPAAIPGAQHSQNPRISEGGKAFQGH